MAVIRNDYIIYEPLTFSANVEAYDSRPEFSTAYVSPYKFSNKAESKHMWTLEELVSSLVNQAKNDPYPVEKIASYLRRELINQGVVQVINEDELLEILG